MNAWIPQHARWPRVAVRLLLVPFCGGFLMVAPVFANPSTEAPPPPAPMETPAQPETSTQPETSAPEEAPIPDPAALLPSLSEPAKKEIFTARNRMQETLRQSYFVYLPLNMLDPFVSFLAPAETLPPKVAVSEEEEDEGATPPEPQRPLTPLQKMSIGEIERGLKAIMWGDLGQRAIIEDSARKGYIVSVGTPCGTNSGVITQIFKDRLIIQQETWDRTERRMVPQNAIVRLKKQ